MRTLLATLERASKATRSADIANVTFFYFTDNIVTYFAVTAGSSTSPGLHSMVDVIKKLEIKLGITLKVVHVPGTTIIEERTNGLSHGIWSSALYQKHDRMAILTEIFAPVPYTAAVSAWAKNQANLPQLLYVTTYIYRPLSGEVPQHSSDGCTGSVGRT